MSNDAIRLHALTLHEIEAAGALLDAGQTDAYIDAVRRAIVRGHTAATWSAIAQRDHAGRIRDWLMRAVPGARHARTERTGDVAMPRADRDRMRELATRELRYFERFAREIRSGQLSPARIKARAAMYAGAIRPAYYEIRYGHWDIPQRLLPGNQQCRANCRCTISVADLGDGRGLLTRRYSPEADHCSECPPLAGTYTIYRRLR